jgi:HlyD family secretion protein
VQTLNYLLAKPSEETIAAAKSDLAVAQAKLEAAQEAYDALFESPDPLEVQKLEAEIAIAQATIETAHLTAPFSGTVTELSMLPGDQVNSGTVALRLDNLDVMLVDMEISELDINQVRVGQSTSLVFDAILGSEYRGKVVEVGLIGDNTSNVVYFPVTVAITDPDQAIRPGMTAVVSIVVSQQAEALLIPNQAVTTLNDKLVVYILGAGGGMDMTPVEVVLGMSSDTYSILIQGDLQAGDRIVLNPTTMLDTQQTTGGGLGLFGLFGGGGVDRPSGSNRPPADGGGLP